jgi:toxin YoeB
MRELRLRDRAISDMNDWIAENPKMLKRIMRIIDECRKTPFDGIGKPEPLKGNLSGCWSRRITDEDRLVYEVTNDLIIIYTMKEHYQ